MSNYLESLVKSHRIIDEKIKDHSNQVVPDLDELTIMKKKKLLIKDKINSLKRSSL